MLYRPRLANGKLAPLAWPLVLYRLTNIICWPLEDNVSRRVYFFDRFLWALGFFIFVFTNDAELRYLRVYSNDLDAMLTGIPTYLVLIEIHLRGFALGLGKEKSKRLLQKFYAEIYIEKCNFQIRYSRVNINDLDIMLEGLPPCLVVSEIYVRGFILGLKKEKLKLLLQKFYAEIDIGKSMHPELFQLIQRKYLLILIFSFFYLCTLLTYILSPFYLIFTGSRELLYKMIPIFDYQALYLYLPILVSNIWVGFVVATMIFGEANVLSLQIFHLNGRYILMRENFIKNVDKILESQRDDDNIVMKYRQLLLSVIHENVRLNTFAQEVQAEFSFRIFIIFSFLAATLCGMLFKVYTSPLTSIGYMFWAVGKTIEIIAYGEMGSTIISTTESIGSMYYESKWESIIARSSDAKANTQIMKLINLAIIVNRKPFSLTGLNFFQVSLASSVAILQGAGSYFTCLIAVR